jgi:glycosyltransferase involved in cell wall biosynthesis
MKILYVIPSIDISAGGPSKSVCDLAVNMVKLGHNVTILTYVSPTPYMIDSSIKDLRVIHVKKFLFCKELHLLNESDEFDLFHGHGLWQFPVHMMARYAREKKIPYIISPRGMLEKKALKSRKIKKNLALWGYQRKDLEYAKCLHATSSDEANNLIKMDFGNQTAFIANGIDLSELPLRNWTEKTGKKTCLFLSRVHPQKGIEMLIESWSRVDKSLRKNWIIEIVGNGDKAYINSLQKLIKNKNLSNEIGIMGPRYNNLKLATYHHADLFVLPTYFESFGNAIAEALACGIPVITTKGTPWEEINTQNAGCWIDIGVEPLVEALEKMMSLSDSERNLIGLNGRKLVEKNYSIGSTVSRMGILYDWVLNGGKKPEFLYE